MDSSTDKKEGQREVKEETNDKNAKDSKESKDAKESKTKKGDKRKRKSSDDDEEDSDSKSDAEDNEVETKVNEEVKAKREAEQMTIKAGMKRRWVWLEKMPVEDFQYVMACQKTTDADWKRISKYFSMATLNGSTTMKNDIIKNIVVTWASKEDWEDLNKIKDRVNYDLLISFKDTQKKNARGFKKLQELFRQNKYPILFPPEKPKKPRAKKPKKEAEKKKPKKTKSKDDSSDEE